MEQKQRGLKDFEMAIRLILGKTLKHDSIRGESKDIIPKAALKSILSQVTAHGEIQILNFEWAYLTCYVESIPNNYLLLLYYYVLIQNNMK